jgi:hypothetical protein
MDTRIALARAYVAAHDALEGQEHQNDLAWLREMDATRLELVGRIEAREGAFTMAQEALFAHDIAATQPAPTVVEQAELDDIFEPAAIADAEPEEPYNVWMDDPSPVVALEEPEDEYATPRPNGLQTEETTYA